MLIKNENKNMYKKLAAVLSVFLLVIFSIFFVAVQSASAGNRLKDSSSFGLGEDRFSVDAQVGVISTNEFEDAQTYEASNTSLATYSTRDISTALSVISLNIENAAKIAAEQARAEELSKINFAKNRRNEHARMYGMPAGLEEVE